MYTGLLSAHAAAVLTSSCLQIGSLLPLHLFELLPSLFGSFHLILLLFWPETVEEVLVNLVLLKGLAVLIDLTLDGGASVVHASELGGQLCPLLLEVLQVLVGFGRLLLDLGEELEETLGVSLEHLF